MQAIVPALDDEEREKQVQAVLASDVRRRSDNA